MNFIIKETKDSDSADIFSVLHQAFGADEEAKLVENLLSDSSAEPVLSLLACKDSKAVGYVLFTKVALQEEPTLRMSILCPLAVIPEYQGQGVGSQLIRKGLSTLKHQRVSFAFVLGDPNYYRRFGFETAKDYGLEAPYPIAAKNVDAWMVRLLMPAIDNNICGKITCAQALNQSKYWVE